MAYFILFLNLEAKLHSKSIVNTDRISRSPIDVQKLNANWLFHGLNNQILNEITISTDPYLVKAQLTD
jgi:hypothetical protein